MRRITRKVRRKRKQIIIISSICLLLCLCVGYAAFGTQLSIRAKGNIKEKPHCMLGGIKVNTVTEGDGLYEDIYEEGKCTYKGANPNNYIKFNDEVWRIVSVDAEGNIKIIRSQSIGNRAWNTTLLNDWTSATLNTYLNGEYLNSIVINTNKIIDGKWSIGPVIEGSYDNLEVHVNKEIETLWDAKVGLITSSEYVRANSNIVQCGTRNLAYTNKEVCNLSNWIYKIIPDNAQLWTITEYNGVSNNAVMVNKSNNLGVLDNYYVTAKYDVFPTLYLTSSIILNGEGSEQNPYIITN